MIQFQTDIVSASLTKLMDMATERQRVVAHNIANVNTPGFKAKDISFQEEFLKAFKNNDMQAIRKVKPKVILDRNSGPMKVDGNNVTVEKELSKQSRAGLAYSIYTELYRKRSLLLKSAMQSAAGG